MATLPQSGISLGSSLPANQAAGYKPARPRRDRLEFWTAFSLIASAIWTPPLFQLALSLAALALVSWTFVRSFEGWRAMGLRINGLWDSAWAVALAVALAAVSITIAAHFGTLQAPAAANQYVYRYAGYAVWSCLQEFLLLAFFLPRLLRLLPGKHLASIAAASLFALVHLPNPVLTPLTAVWGYISCLIFLRYRTLYTPALVHALLGITIALTVPASADHHMRVGLGYLDEREYSPSPAAARTSLPLRPVIQR